MASRTKCLLAATEMKGRLLTNENKINFEIDSLTEFILKYLSGMTVIEVDHIYNKATGYAAC